MYENVRDLHIAYIVLAEAFSVGHIRKLTRQAQNCLYDSTAATFWISGINIHTPSQTEGVHIQVADPIAPPLFFKSMYTLTLAHDTPQQ